jgi:hypothetical protein
MMDDTAGLPGLTPIDAGYLSHLIVAAVAGAGFGIISRFQANSSGCQSW